MTRLARLFLLSLNASEMLHPLLRGLQTNGITQIHA